MRSVDPQNGYSTVGSPNRIRIFRIVMRIVQRTRSRNPRSFVEMSSLSSAVADREMAALRAGDIGVIVANNCSIEGPMRAARTSGRIYSRRKQIRTAEAVRI